LKYKKKLIENGFKKITIPEQGEEFEIWYQKGIKN
jgi:hypothetical protein